MKSLCFIFMLMVVAMTAQAADAIIFRTASACGEKPFETAKAAAESLKHSLGGITPAVVIVADCYEDKENKEQMLKGVASVFDANKLVGGSFYGMFTHQGSAKQDAVALLAIGGRDVTIRTACEKDMGAAGLTLEKDKEKLTSMLNSAGARLAKQFGSMSDSSLMILISDAHSPKNQLLLDGVQSVVGTKLPITGASVNKNAGQNWIYWRGQVYTDAAVAVSIGGPIRLAMSGRQAKDNDQVIATARAACNEATNKLGKAPFAILAFDCAGRMGKLKNLGDELAAIRAAIGADPVLFGCYGAGEYGPPDAGESDAKGHSCGRGWHVMITALDR